MLFFRIWTILPIESFIREVRTISCPFPVPTRTHSNIPIGGEDLMSVSFISKQDTALCIHSRCRLLLPMLMALIGLVMPPLTPPLPHTACRDFRFPFCHDRLYLAHVFKAETALYVARLRYLSPRTASPEKSPPATVYLPTTWPEMS